MVIFATIKPSLFCTYLSVPAWLNVWTTSRHKNPFSCQSSDKCVRAEQVWALTPSSCSSVNSTHSDTAPTVWTTDDDSFNSDMNFLNLLSARNIKLHFTKCEKHFFRSCSLCFHPLKRNVRFPQDMDEEYNQDRRDNLLTFSNVFFSIVFNYLMVMYICYKHFHILFLIYI